MDIRGDEIQWKVGMMFSWGSKNCWFEVLDVRPEGIVASQYKRIDPIDIPVWYMPTPNGYTQMFETGYFYDFIITLENVKHNSNYKRGKYAIRFSPRSS